MAGAGPRAPRPDTGLRRGGRARSAPGPVPPPPGRASALRPPGGSVPPGPAWRGSRSRSPPPRGTPRRKGAGACAAEPRSTTLPGARPRRGGASGAELGLPRPHRPEHQGGSTPGKAGARSSPATLLYLGDEAGPTQLRAAGCEAGGSPGPPGPLSLSPPQQSRRSPEPGQEHGRAPSHLPAWGTGLQGRKSTAPQEPAATGSPGQVTGETESPWREQRSSSAWDRTCYPMPLPARPPGTQCSPQHRAEVHPASAQAAPMKHHANTLTLCHPFKSFSSAHKIY